MSIVEYRTSFVATEEYRMNDIPEQALWCDVLEVAVDDLTLPTNHMNCSFKWFLSDRFEIGSFLWICFHLDISPHYIITGLGAKLYKHLLRI